MTARTATVFCGVTLPDGTPYTGQPVPVTLNTPTAFTADGLTEIVRTAYATQTPTGFEITLPINDDIDPSGTTWRLRVARLSWTFQLTAAHAGLRVPLRPVIVDAPTNPAPMVAALNGVTITNAPTAVGQVLFCTSLSPLTAAWSTPVAGSSGGSSPDLTYGGGVYGAGVYSPAA
jgi:hypothetical protein